MMKTGPGLTVVLYIAGALAWGSAWPLSEVQAADSPASSSAVQEQPVPHTGTGDVKERGIRKDLSSIIPAAPTNKATRPAGGLNYSCPATSTICGCRGAADCKVLEGAGKCAGTLECTFSTPSGQPECTCTKKAATIR